MRQTVVENRLSDMIYVCRISVVILVCGGILTSCENQAKGRNGNNCTDKTVGCADGAEGIRYDVSPENGADKTRLREFAVVDAVTPNVTDRGTSTAVPVVVRGPTTPKNGSGIEPVLKAVPSVSVPPTGPNNASITSAKKAAETIPSAGPTINNATGLILPAGSNTSMGLSQPVAPLNNVTGPILPRPDTTTESAHIAPTYGTEVLHFVLNKYCYCDITVSTCFILCRIVQIVDLY